MIGWSLVELILFASDFHFGRKTAAWDVGKASATLSALAEQAVAIARSAKVDSIHLLFLGDIVDGESVYFEQAYELELQGFEQVYECARLFALNFLLPLSEIAPCHLDGVPGNHAYLRFTHRRTNLDSFFYRELERWAKSFKRRGTTTFWARMGLDALEIKVTRCGSVSVLIGHGHFFRSVADLPFAAAYRRVLAWTATRAKDPFDIAAFGHFHRFAFFAVPGGKFVVFNGCMLAHDEYSLTRYGHPGDRVWAALLVDRKKILALHPLRDERLGRDRKEKVGGGVIEKRHDPAHRRPLPAPETARG